MFNNNMYKPQNIIADQDGILISINDAVSHQKGLTCPCCGARLIVRAKDSIYMQPHFVHEAGAACTINCIRNSDTVNARKSSVAGEGFTTEELNYYKDRLSKIQTVLKVINKIKKEGLYVGYADDLYHAIVNIAYEDQVMVYYAILKKSCCTSIMGKIATAINGAAIGAVRNELNALFGFRTIDVLALEQHSIVCTYKGMTFEIKNVTNKSYSRVKLSLEDMEVVCDYNYVKKHLDYIDNRVAA